MTQQKVPHKHAAMIKAWADGATIQYKWETSNFWNDVKQPTWRSECDYRVKPEPKPDVVMYAMIRKSGEYSAAIDPVFASIKKLLDTDTCMFVFDGETGALKDCQVLAHE